MSFYYMWFVNDIFGKETHLIELTIIVHLMLKNKNNVPNKTVQ